MIYLDNAATTGQKPPEVERAVLNAIKKYSANPGRSGHVAAQRCGEFVYGVREKVAAFFGALPEEVIFTQNCTQSANFVIKGVLGEGDHAIISSMEHNAVARPIHTLKSRGIIDYDIAEVILGDREATARSFERLIKPNTKLIICTHASNVNGEILPIEEIAKICQKNNILFAVDAAQTAGILQINMEKTRIDFLFVAPHKGLYAPMGTGVLIARKKIEKTIIEGGTGSFSNMLLQPEDLPERFESGTLNVPGIAGIYAGIDFVKKRGIDNIYKHENELCERLIAGLEKIKNITVFRLENVKYAPVVSFDFDGVMSMAVADYLSQKGIATRAGLHCAPLAHLTLGTAQYGTVRISPAAFNRHTDIDALIFAAKGIKKF